MILAATAILACSMNIVATAADTASSRREYHVRTTDARVRGWIDAGARESRTFNVLLDRLAASDVIVYVQLVNRIPSGADGQLFFVTSTGTARYLRIELVPRGHRSRIISVLGHELQHAVEIANARWVKDTRAISTLYRRVGDLSTRYESLDARITGERIGYELATYQPARERSTARHEGEQSRESHGNPSVIGPRSR
jgi:hypothetical protein